MTHARKAAALIGAGAIGLPLAAALAQTGRDVVVCGGREPISRIEITQAGHTRSWSVKHVARPEDVPDVDYIIVAVKAHQSESIAPWLRACANEGVVVLAAQNGIEHSERLGPFVNGAEIIPSVLFFNNERTAPGKAFIRRVHDNYIALPDAKGSRSLAKELVDGGIDARVITDWKVVAWTKFLVNLTASPLTALTDRDADVMCEPNIAELGRSIMTEALNVAVAEGVPLTAAHVDNAMAWAQGVAKGTRTSMREDRAAGRALEYDAFTGALIRAAERHGIDVPANKIVYALTAAIQPTATGP